MLNWYKKFCCGIFYSLKEKAKSDVPFYATFMFTLFLFILIVFGIDSIIYLFLKTKYKLSGYFIYSLIITFAIPNYLIVFKNKKFLALYDMRLSYLKVLLIVGVIFFSSLLLILKGGVRGI